MQKRTTDNELSTSENTTLDLKHMSYHIVLWIQKQRKEERLLNLISLPHITLKQMFKTKKILLFPVFILKYFSKDILSLTTKHKKSGSYSFFKKESYCNSVHVNLCLFVKKNKLNANKMKFCEKYGLCVCVHAWLLGFRGCGSLRHPFPNSLLHSIPHNQVLVFSWE